MKPQPSIPRLAWALAPASLLLACTSPTNSDSFPSSFMSDHGKLSIHLSTAPEQPPYAGNDSVELILTDPKTGKPIENEDISLVPFMPTMGHGTDTTPQLQVMGKGRYVFTNVNLYMPGEWQLRFQFSGPVNDSAAPDIADVL
jgi:hypothetical protein